MNAYGAATAAINRTRDKFQRLGGASFSDVLADADRRLNLRAIRGDSEEATVREDGTMVMDVDFTFESSESLCGGRVNTGTASGALDFQKSTVREVLVTALLIAGLLVGGAVAAAKAMPI